MREPPSSPRAFSPYNRPMASKRRTTRLTGALLRRYYPDRPTDFEHFAEKVREHLAGAGRVLDVGAGAGIIDALDWRAPGRRVIGIDLDPRVRSNPNLDSGLLADARALPFPDNTFDSAVSVNVFEHIPDPAAALREVSRVLVPGGLFCIKTPNRDHYVGRIARITPDSFHKWYNSLRGRNPEDTFPTTYRFNRFPDIRRVAEEAGFEVLDLDAFEGVPEYLLLSAVLFLPGLAYERWANARPGRAKWRANMEVILHKPPPP